MRIGIGGGGGTIDAAVESVQQAKDATKVAAEEAFAIAAE